MLTLPLDTRQGCSRRSFLRLGSMSLFGLSLPRLLQLQARAAEAQAAAARPAGLGKDVNCILIWTDGGMSNIDTLDMKPDAPIEYRGEFRPIPSNVPGIELCELMPRMARVMDKVCLVKSIAHAESGDHVAATHYMLTGYPQRPDPTGQPPGALVHPMFGSVVARQQGWQKGMPPNVQLASRIFYSGAGYFGSQYDPLVIRSDPNAADFRIEDVSIPEAVGVERTARRRNMLERLDAWQRRLENVSDVVRDRGQFYRQAFDLITSPAAKNAFRLDQESEAIRERYGRTRDGQAALLARRMVEAGVRFVTIGSSGWDTHDNNFGRLRSPLLPTLDQAWSALLEDLDQRGLLDSTLVICAGEFGRTPKVNGAAGRDHYAPCNVVGLSGAGVARGAVVGRTDARCEQVVGQTNSTQDYAATLYRILGVDVEQEYVTQDGRPMKVVSDGHPIVGVLS